MNPQQDIICSILGLSDDVSSYLKVINPEYKDHKKVHSWIEDFMGSKRIAIMDDQSIVDQILGLGFIPAKARALANQIEVNEYSGHQTTLQWAEDHIKSRTTSFLQGNHMRAPQIHSIKVESMEKRSIFQPVKRKTPLELDLLTSVYRQRESLTTFPS